MKRFLLKISMLMCLSIGHLSAQSIEGEWEGTLNFQGMKLRLVFHFLDTNAGYSATMDSPDQGANGIPVDEVNFKAPKLKLTIKAANISYSGVVATATNLWDDSIAGTFEQNGMQLPLLLRRSNIEHAAFSDKPKEPMPPFPYPTEEVSFQHDGITLGGTLSMPKGVTSAPAVILISGSGQQNRDEEIMGHKPFLVIADYLTKNGYAVLRYDDRGIGASTGSADSANSADFAQDVLAAISYLKSRKDITTIGLIGHSEGSIIAAMVAAENKDVAFVISLAGPGIKGDSLLLLQQRLIFPEYSLSVEATEKAISQNRALFAIINLNKSLVETEQLIRAYFNTQEIPLPESGVSKDDWISSIVSIFNTPWMRFFLQHNPADDFSKVHCPVLALNGDKDKQVPAEVNLGAIDKALKKANNKHYTIKECKGKNHLFQTCTTGSISEYANITETFSPEVMAFMLNWMNEISIHLEMDKK